MKLTEFFAAQLDREAAITRRALERVPEGRPDWKPHEKSMPLGYLTQLVAQMPSWIALAITQDELDLNPPGGSKIKAPDHRGQLTVYLRLNGVPVPSIYGPTADDKSFG